eukprot:TRINITY_DN305_c1_g1_i1.p1 TRINITY_DN305_c1_g1~~TRINITY_DN305_c1_g1_i1.p1  ORF type:complete len:104 (+),score=12.82 TRINITY_DN305_c1_g1_i1:588-899(+)
MESTEIPLKHEESRPRSGRKSDSVHQHMQSRRMTFEAPILSFQITQKTSRTDVLRMILLLAKQTSHCPSPLIKDLLMMIRKTQGQSNHPITASPHLLSNCTVK